LVQSQEILFHETMDGVLRTKEATAMWSPEPMEFGGYTALASSVRQDKDFIMLMWTLSIRTVKADSRQNAPIEIFYHQEYLQGPAERFSSLATCQPL
jgi:hypothetical protein